MSILSSIRWRFWLLPVRVPTALVLIIAFFYWSFIDVFDNSLGVHAGASVLIAYIRNLSLRL